MARAFVRVGLCLGLSSCCGLWSLGAAAQGSGDIVEDESEPGEQQASNDQNEESEEDSGDGDWSSEGGGAPGASGFHFGLRLGYGFALGKTGGSGGGTSALGGDMTDNVAGQIPIWVDLGWQFSPSFMLGAYFSYGFVLPKGDLADECDAARSGCTLSDMRLGLQAQLSFSPGRSTDPWLGVGAGYEWFTVDVGDATYRLHGWEMLMLQGGIDFGGDTGGSTIGPFAALSVAQFSQYRVKFGSIDESDSIDDKAMHEWLFVGIRGVVK